jgi:hypothetical protein
MLMPITIEELEDTLINLGKNKLLDHKESHTKILFIYIKTLN